MNVASEPHMDVLVGVLWKELPVPGNGESTVHFSFRA